MSAEEYHADPCPPSLSASIAHVMTRESPAHARLKHPRLGGKAHEHSDAFDRGTLAHRLLLGVGGDIAVIDAGDWRTKAAQTQREEARATHKIPVLASDHATAQRDVDMVRAEMTKLGFVLDGESEVTALWGAQAFGGEMAQCRGMIDHLSGRRVYDLKSIWSAHPDVCQRHIDAYGYAIQQAAYVSALETLRPTLAGRFEFVFVFFELDAPYAVTPIMLSGEFRELGKRQWLRAVDTWARCLRTGEWPTYTNSIIKIEPKPWAIQRDMDRQIAEASAGWSKER